MDSAGMIAELSQQFADGLPKYTLDARLQGLASWVLASLGPGVVKTLPVFWQKSVATTIMGCRMLRVGVRLAKSRSALVDEFCCNYIEWLWSKYGRKEIALLCIGQNAIHKFDFQDAYDALWTWMTKEV